MRAFGRAADELEASAELPADVAIERATGALERARAVLRFAGDGEDAYALELRALCESLEPAVRLMK